MTSLEPRQGVSGVGIVPLAGGHDRRDWLLNGPREDDLLCNACGVRGLARLPGEAWRRRCRCCGFQAVVKVEIMPAGKGVETWL